jgi:hypothetical protein
VIRVGTPCIIRSAPEQRQTPFIIDGIEELRKKGFVSGYAFRHTVPSGETDRLEPLRALRGMAGSAAKADGVRVYGDIAEAMS